MIENFVGTKSWRKTLEELFLNKKTTKTKIWYIYKKQKHIWLDPRIVFPALFFIWLCSLLRRFAKKYTIYMDISIQYILTSYYAYGTEGCCNNEILVNLLNRRKKNGKRVYHLPTLPHISFSLIHTGPTSKYC